MKRHASPPLVLIVSILFFSLLSCNSQDTAQAPTAPAAPGPITKKPFVQIGSYSTIIGYASFGDPKDCMNKGICGAHLDEPKPGDKEANSYAPAVFMYKQDAGLNTIIILIDPTTLKNLNPPPPPPANFPPPTIGDPGSATNLVIDKSFFGTAADLNIPFSTRVSFMPAAAPSPFAVLSFSWQ